MSIVAPLLTADAVETIIVYCLFDEDEAPEGKVPDDAVLIDGIMNRWAFHPGRLEKKRLDIVALLSELSDVFFNIRSGGGGGYSFLAACTDRNGNLWGQQFSVDQLFSLGRAIRVVTELLPRKYWSALPGGMPYYRIDL